MIILFPVADISPGLVTENLQTESKSFPQEFINNNELVITIFSAQISVRLLLKSELKI